MASALTQERWSEAGGVGEHRRMSDERRLSRPSSAQLSPSHNHWRFPGPGSGRPVLENLIGRPSMVPLAAAQAAPKKPSSTTHPAPPSMSAQVLAEEFEVL